MEVKINCKPHNSWESNLHYVEYTETAEKSFSFSIATLSKQSILLYFAGLPVLNETEMFILDHLSKLHSLVFYNENNNLVFNLDNGVELRISANYDTIKKIIKTCTIKQY